MLRHHKKAICSLTLGLASSALSLVTVRPISVKCSWAVAVAAATKLCRILCLRIGQVSRLDGSNRSSRRAQVEQNLLATLESCLHTFPSLDTSPSCVTL